MKKKRNSSIELLKIIAIILIVISHSVPYGAYTEYVSRIKLELCTSSISNLFLVFLRYLGSIGNCIFIVCSSYYLLDSKKINISKIIKIVLYSIIISGALLIISSITGLHDNVSLNSFRSIMHELTDYWFIWCYLLLYLVHHFLNIIIEHLSKKQLLSFCIFLIISYGLLNPIVNAFLAYNFLYYNLIIGYIMIYFIVAYYKLYGNKIFKNKNRTILLMLSSIVFLFLSVITINYLGLKYNIFNNKLLLLNKFDNPLIIIFCISLFNIFIKKDYYNKIINYFSGLSLYIYLVHGNYLFENYIKGYYYDYIVKSISINKIFETLLLTAFFLFISIIGSAIFNKLFGKLIDFLSTKASSLIDRFFNKLNKLI